jgi:protein SCO1
MRSLSAGCAALVAALALLAGCASDDPPDAAAPATAATTGADTSGHAGTDHVATDHDGHAIGPVTYEGGTISPVRQAPPLKLRDIDGRMVDIRDLRGAPVLVTFVYANCPDVCPLIMNSLAEARRDAGKAGRATRVIAVSVDPAGDTPAVVRRFLDQRGVAGFVDYLIGSRPALERTWADWGVATDVPTDDPELIEHTSLIYGVSASGELVTAYPVGFESAAVARDLPRLAAS